MTLSLIDRLTVSRSRLRFPPRTVRFRLTALYSGLFLVAAVGLLAINYVLVDRSTAPALFVSGKDGAAAVQSSPGGTSPAPRSASSPTVQELQLARQLLAQATAQHANDLHQLVTGSLIALAIMALLAIVLGWLMSGRVLRPLRTMTTATQQITERNLHERLALRGPSDEVKDLADTIDGLLARLESAFDAQRHFVANASHELRTPLTLARALLEVALSDRHATVDDLRSTCDELLASFEQQERLIEALLTLASSERGLDRKDSIDLAAIADKAISMHRADAEHQGLQVNTSLGSAWVLGNPDLLERMIANLVDNAIRYNLVKGHIDVVTEAKSEHSILTVANSGPLVPQDAVDRLFRPFQRLDGGRTTHPEGHGLGLSIVRAIAATHHAGLKVQVQPGGGLNVEVHFPTPTPFTKGHHESPPLSVVKIDLNEESPRLSNDDDFQEGAPTSAVIGPDRRGGVLQGLNALRTDRGSRRRHPH